MATEETPAGGARQETPAGGARQETPAGGARQRTPAELNAELLYCMYSVFRVRPGTALGEADRSALAAEVDQLLEQALGKDVYTRGSYDVSGYRADADVMFWWTCPDPERLQEVYARLRQTGLGRVLEPVWSVVGVHRPAEFNRDHIPAFVAREDPKRVLCVYPFDRSLEWYLLPAEERREMLAEHGRMAVGFKDVRANTVSAFGLGDYEWLLAFEADTPDRIVDCIRELRGAKARRHTRLETPFFTGTRKPLAELVAALP